MKKIPLCSQSCRGAPKKSIWSKKEKIVGLLPEHSHNSLYFFPGEKERENLEGVRERERAK